MARFGCTVCVGVFWAGDPVCFVCGREGVALYSWDTPTSGHAYSGARMSAPCAGEYVPVDESVEQLVEVPK